MTKEEFEEWYKEKQTWLNYKSRYLLSTINWDFNENKELVSLTIENF